MRIKSYQVGGAIYTPFTPAQTAAQAQSSSSSASASGSDEGNPTNKDYAKEIMKVVQEKGLPSDVDAFLKMADRLLGSASTYGSSLLPGGGETDFSMSDIIKLQSYANKIVYNADIAKSAGSELNKNGTRSEIALDSNGNVFAINKKGSLERISANELYKSQGEYQPLTNAQLINFRATGKGLEFNAGILEDLQGNISTASVQKHVNEMISKLGNLSIEEQTHTGIGDDIIKGAQALIQKGQEGYYSVTEKDSLKKNMNAALKYVWDSLNPEYKARLRVNSAIQGIDPSKAYETILNTLNTNSTQEYSSKLIKTDEDIAAARAKAAGDAAEAKSKSLENIPRFLQIATGSFENRRTFQIAPKVDKIAHTTALQVTGVDNGTAMFDDNKPVGDVSLKQLQNASDFRGVDLTSGSVTVGGKVLDESKYGTVMFDKNEHIYTVDMPYTVSPDGKKVVDLKSFDNINKFKEWCKSAGNITIQEKRKKLQEFGLDPSRWNDEKKEYDFPDVEKFVCFSAFVGKRSGDITKDEARWMQELDGDKQKYYKDLLNNIIVYGDANPSANAKKLKTREGDQIGGFLKSSTVYKTWCFALADPKKAATYVNNYRSKSDFVDVDRKMAARDVEEAIRDQYDGEIDTTLGQWK